MDDMTSKMYSASGSGAASVVTVDEFKAYVKEIIGQINSVLKEYISRVAVPEKVDGLIGKSPYTLNLKGLKDGLLDPGEYLFSMSGNRHRPVLMLTLVEALGGDRTALLEYAIMPEMIHNATLVHDDIEDNSPKRRGVDAVHTKFKMPVANNLGDFLYYFPVEAVLRSKPVSPEAESVILRLYMRTMLRATTGQALDLAWSTEKTNRAEVTESNYMRMVELKSGALLAFACELAGALTGASREKIDSLGKAGMTLGVGFQIIDDLENLVKGVGIAEKKGGAGEDITEGKVTPMVIHALSNANPADKARLLELLGQHTKDPALIDEAIGIMDKYGSLEYARKLAEKKIGEAWEIFDGQLPDSIAKSRIKTMISYLLNRTT